METSREISTATASPIVATKTASITVIVDDDSDIVPYRENKGRTHKCRTRSVPALTKKSSSPEKTTLKTKLSGFSRQLGAGHSGSNRSSVRRKGRSFLSSLEEMLQKSAARKAAACLRRDAAISVSIQLEDTAPSEDSETETAIQNDVINSS